MTTTTITRATESTAAVADATGALAETPVAAPSDTPVAAPAAAPVSAPTDTSATAPAVAPVAAPAAAPATAAAVDVSAIPETPAELLKQWQAPRRPLLHTLISATLVRLWDALTGPGMTDQQRINRAIAEHNGYARNLGRKF